MIRHHGLSILLSFFLFFPVISDAQEQANSIQIPPTPPSIGKKMIELGWDCPSTQFLRDHWQEMEAKSPFDGVIFHLAPEGKISSFGLMDAQVWQKDDYASCIDDLKACSFQQFTDNFINIFFSPGSVAWDDDAGWAAVAEKAGICAWVAQEGGCKGLSLDFESYGSSMFLYKSDSPLSFEETCTLAERRGREFIQAVAAQKPDAVLLCLWMNSFNFHAGSLENPSLLLVSSPYGLLPSFINGMLDAAPPEMILVDGCEFGYYYNSQEEYQKAALDILLWSGPAIKLVKSELRHKYRDQVQAGFGFYLDMFTNPEGDIHYRGPKEGGTRLDRLHDNLSYAWNAADQYVWVYGEKNRWWNIEAGGPECKYWDDALPGLLDSLFAVKDLKLAIKKSYEKTSQEKPLVNLLQNGDFSQGTDGESPSHWWIWQEENKPQGTLLWNTDGTATAKNVFNGCFAQDIPVQPGEFHSVRVQIKSNRILNASVRIRWKSPEDAWVYEILDRYAEPISLTPDDNGYYTYESYVQVPPDAGFLVLLLSAQGQGPDDSITFDNAIVY